MVFFASVTKSFDMSRIFRYGLPKDILSNGQKPKDPPPLIDTMQSIKCTQLLLLLCCYASVGNCIA